MMRLGLVMTNEHDPEIFFDHHITVDVGSRRELTITRSDAARIHNISIVAPGRWAVVNLEPYVEEGE